MPYATYSTPVDASLQLLWKILLDKIEHPERYMAEVEETEFLEDTEEYAVREIRTSDMALQEKITINESLGEVRFSLLNHPFFEGDVIHAIVPSTPQPTLTITMDWRAKNEEAQQVEGLYQEQLEQDIHLAAEHIKNLAEHLEKQPG